MYFLKNKRMGSLVFSGLGLVALCIAGIFTWIALGNDFYSRLFYLSPMIVGFIIGIILFKIQSQKDKYVA